MKRNEKRSSLLCFATCLDKYLRGMLFVACHCRLQQKIQCRSQPHLCRQRQQLVLHYLCQSNNHQSGYHHHLHLNFWRSREWEIAWYEWKIVSVEGGVIQCSELCGGFWWKVRPITMMLWLYPPCLLVGVLSPEVTCWKCKLINWLI